MNKYIIDKARLTFGVISFVYGLYFLREYTLGHTFDMTTRTLHHDIVKGEVWQNLIFFFGANFIGIWCILTSIKKKFK